MTSLKIMKTADVGDLITKVLKGATDLSSDVHTVLVQCALHIRDNGDTSLAQRFTDGLTSDQNNAKGSAAVLNVQGIRAWFGMACPMIVDRTTKRWKLIDKGSETYTKYCDRMLRHTISDEEKMKVKADKNYTPDLATSQPDKDTGPGGRIFFIQYMAGEPFWTNDDVQRSQAANLRVSGLDGVLKLATNIQGQVDRLIENGNLLPDAIPLVTEFVTNINVLVADFKAKHAVELVGEGAKIAAFKRAKEIGETMDVQAEVQQSPAPDSGAPEVGGDVTTGLEDTPDEAADAGSQSPQPEPTEEEQQQAVNA
jgi:hypothetical protein